MLSWFVTRLMLKCEVALPFLVFYGGPIEIPWIGSLFCGLVNTYIERRMLTTSNVKNSFLTALASNGCTWSFCGILLLLFNLDVLTALDRMEKLRLLALLVGTGFALAMAVRLSALGVDYLLYNYWRTKCRSEVR